MVLQALTVWSQSLQLDIHLPYAPGASILLKVPEPTMHARVLGKRFCLLSPEPPCHGDSAPRLKGVSAARESGVRQPPARVRSVLSRSDLAMSLVTRG